MNAPFEFDHAAAFDPAESAETLADGVPTGWCVYALLAEGGRPLQLLCVKNLRASLRRRLGETSADADPTRRIDYRAVVRSVAWTRVDSTFEQDVVYLDAARSLFPESYAAVLGFRRAWYVEVDPAADGPRFTRTQEPTAGSLAFGPLTDGRAARKLAHAVEDLFDLCRDARALAAAPAGPCQWREMGKCVGPCDGSADLASYRALVAHAAEALADPERAATDARFRMRQAAAAQDYEAAGRIKAFAEGLAGLRAKARRHARPLAEFRFLAVLPGRAKGSAKLFTVVGGSVRPLCCLIAGDDKRAVEPAVRAALAALDAGGVDVLDEAGRETASLVTHHLFPSRRSPGAFLHAGEVDAAAVVRAVREVWKPAKPSATAAADAEDGEGEVRGSAAV